VVRLAAEVLAGTEVRLVTLPAVEVRFGMDARGGLVLLIDKPDWAVVDGRIDFLAAELEPEPDLSEANPDPATSFFAAGPIFSLPSSSFLAAIKLILALLAAVSRGSTELILPCPVPAAEFIVLGTGLALNSVLFFASSSFFSRSSRCTFIFAEMMSPGRVKLDLVGGLADLAGTKPGFAVESFLLILRFGAVDVGTVGDCLAVVVKTVGCVDGRDLIAVTIEGRA
jgi:hypothetical protein